MHKLSYADYVNLIDALERGVPLSATQQQIVRAAVQVALAKDPTKVNTREFVVEAVKAAYTFVDPKAPQTLFVEYVGACRQWESPMLNRFGRRQQTMSTCRACNGRGLRPSRSTRLGTVIQTCQVCNGQGRTMQGFVAPEPYASGWVDDGWNIIFPESTLRAFFTFETPFDGNFHKLLLNSSDLPKEYKKLARKYHPDVNRGRSQYFLKLKRAYDDLKDPRMRKRYEAGLKFQQALEQKDHEEVLRVPKSCGNVSVIGKHNDRNQLEVSQILAWEDVVDDLGRTLTATWSKPASTYGEMNRKPFVHSYQFKGDTEFEVTVA